MTKISTKLGSGLSNLKQSLVESNYTEEFKNESDRPLQSGYGSDDSDVKHWEQKNIVDSVNKIKKFMKSYKRAA